ncbi:Oxygen-independent coproporphyrinogen-III oxidase 1 [Gimesia panareensis]|uniref:Oxygen-independent coproporphyrinogen-III oxidase 1 n=1 Tax=Gimesia panareensis TaxID=2527978 RepID=A0A517QBP6_9PLAN|nr:coproporphyrinogen-III oxidase family protein [Gimesia panareensis]QDT29060.1 Oxygen-independent coproporphyrinogen-III oxidase 1 [Gimesia panareensis]
MDLETTGTTEIGSYFISNYPPFSQWKQEYVTRIQEVLHQPPDTSIPMGLYIHIPFCRKRCKFCYFRVYEKQNAKTIERYVQALQNEFEMLSQVEAIKGRTLDFTYFGGGTPSYLSSKQLLSVRDRLSSLLNWETAQEVTFECEPGTLNLEKVKTLKEIGITRISLGVESFNDKLLEANGRAHLTPEVFRAYDWIQEVGFPQVNIDLIAGMMGETDDNWSQAVEKAAELNPDNITIYQMELPHNTIISKEMKEMGIDSPIADWTTKRRWMNEAIDTLQAKGYHLASGNELVKNPETDRFIYRDNLFRGNDIIATGVSSFGHMQGVHYQNLDRLEDYLETVESGKLPVNRALEPTEHQRLIREFILQLKEGRVRTQPFQEKFGVDLTEEFAEALSNQQKAGYLTYDDSQVELTRKGMLQVDSLLTEYFEPEHRMVRYT